MEKEQEKWLAETWAKVDAKLQKVAVRNRGRSIQINGLPLGRAFGCGVSKI